MTNLSQESCIPCKGGTPPFTQEEIQTLLPKLSPDWKVIENHHLEREFKFPNFQTALDFTNKVGQIAEKEGHHPDIALSWGKVKITLFTHKVKGLSKNDFILASKIDSLNSV